MFRELNSPNLVYWHDCGHAQIKANLGFIHHALHLESLAPRLAGFHVHDVIYPAGDHAAPGTGTVDFASLKPFVKPEHIKVFELSPSLPVESPSLPGGSRQVRHRARQIDLGRRMISETARLVCPAAVR